MNELLRYNKSDDLIEVVEFNRDGSVLTLHSLNDNNLVRFWEQELDGEIEKYLEYIEYADRGVLSSMRMDGYRWTRVFKKGTSSLELAKTKERVTTVNGELTSVKISDEFLKLWKSKITTKSV